MERLWHSIEDAADDFVAVWVGDPRPRPKDRRRQPLRPDVRQTQEERDAELERLSPSPRHPDWDD